MSKNELASDHAEMGCIDIALLTTYMNVKGAFSKNICVLVNEKKLIPEPEVQAARGRLNSKGYCLATQA